MPYIGCSSCKKPAGSCGNPSFEPSTVTPGVPTCFWIALVGFLLFAKGDK